MKLRGNEEVAGGALALVGAAVVGSLGLCVAHSTGPATGGEGARSGLVAFLGHLNSPGQLAQFMLGLYLVPYLPRLMDWLASAANRLTKVELGDVSIELQAAEQEGTGASLALASGPEWQIPRALWAGSLPESELAVQETVDGLEASQRAAFDGWTDEAKRFVGHITAEVRFKPRHSEWFEARYRDFEQLERGWDGEHVRHLERSASVLTDGDPLRDGLDAGLGKTVLFRRLMLLDHELKTKTNDAHQVSRRASELVDCLEYLSNDVRRGFYERPAAAGLLLLLVQLEEPKLLKMVADDAHRKWISGKRRSSSMSLPGVETGFREAAELVEHLRDFSVVPLEIFVASPVDGTRCHKAFRVVRHLLRARVADQLAAKCCDETRSMAKAQAVQHASAVLQATSQPEGIDYRQVRVEVLRVLARNWQLGHLGVDSLLAETPDLMTQPAALNDLARSILAAGSTPAEVSMAHRLLRAAAALPSDETDRKTIESNLKELNA